MEFVLFSPKKEKLELEILEDFFYYSVKRAFDTFADAIK